MLRSVKKGLTCELDGSLGFLGGTSIGSSGVLPGTAPIELVLDVPGERAPSGCSAPALRLRCLCAYVGERVLADPVYSREGRIWSPPSLQGVQLVITRAGCLSYIRPPCAAQSCGP